MDLSTQTDDVSLEIAAVLDEVSAVHCRLVKKAKVKRDPVPCSYFLQSEKENKILQKFWEKNIVAIDSEYVDRISGVGATSREELYSHIPENDDELDSLELPVYDMDQAERFAGIVPETFKWVDSAREETPEAVFLDYWKSVDSPERSPPSSKELFPDYDKVAEIIDEKMPPVSEELLADYWEDFLAEASTEKISPAGKPFPKDEHPIDATLEQKPYADCSYQQPTTMSSHVDVPTIVETAKQYFTEEDIIKLHGISKTFENLEDKYTSEDCEKDESEIADSMMDDVLKEHIAVTQDRELSFSSPLDNDHVGRDRLISITEFSDVEPEDSTQGWLVSPEVYSDSSPVEIVDDLEAINETAHVFVENIISEAKIVVESWSRAMLQMDKRQSVGCQSVSETASKEKLEEHCGSECEKPVVEVIQREDSTSELLEALKSMRSDTELLLKREENGSSHNSSEIVSETSVPKGKISDPLEKSSMEDIQPASGITLVEGQIALSNNAHSNSQPTQLVTEGHKEIVGEGSELPRCATREKHDCDIIDMNIQVLGTPFSEIYKEVTPSAMESGMFIVNGESKNGIDENEISSEFLCRSDGEQKRPVVSHVEEKSSELSLPQISTAFSSFDERKIDFSAQYTSADALLDTSDSIESKLQFDGKKSDFSAQHTSTDGLLDTSTSVETKPSSSSSTGTVFSKLCCCCMASKTGET